MATRRLLLGKTPCEPPPGSGLNSVVDSALPNHIAHQRARSPESGVASASPTSCELAVTYIARPGGRQEPIGYGYRVIRANLCVNSSRPRRTRAGRLRQHQAERLVAHLT
jgi:hypothetical protein